MISEAHRQESKEKKELRKVAPKVHVVFDMTTARLLQTGGKVYAEELENALRENAKYRVTCISGTMPPLGGGLGIKPVPGLIRPSDEKIIFGSTLKFRRDTRWKPAFSLEQTLKSMLEYWEERL